MAEYISRAAAERAAHMAFVRGHDAMQYATMIHLIAKLPAADVVEVVRCADCIYWEEIECSEYGVCNRAMDIRPHETIYCAFGERKDGADNG